MRNKMEQLETCFCILLVQIFKMFSSSCVQVHISWEYIAGSDFIKKAIFPSTNYILSAIFLFFFGNLATLFIQKACFLPFKFNL